MLDEADGVDDKLAVLVPTHGFPKPGRFRIWAVLAVKIDAAHPLVPLPDDPDLLRGLDEIDGLGHEQQLTWDAPRPAAGLGGEGSVAAAHQIVMHPHLRGRPRLQIGVPGIGHALDPLLDPRSRIACHGCDLALDGPEIKAGVELPAEVGGHKLRNGAFLRSSPRNDTHCDQGDQRRTAKQRHFEHRTPPRLRGLKRLALEWRARAQICLRCAWMDIRSQYPLQGGPL